MQVGSGVVESGCRQYGLRLKRPGTRWSERGANAMLALKSCVMNLRLPEFLDWQATRARRWVEHHSRVPAILDTATISAPRPWGAGARRTPTG